MAKRRRKGGNPVRNMYWALRKKGLSSAQARRKVKKHFKL